MNVSIYTLKWNFVQSVLEGGPVLILESMMSNCVPVASKTGFCPILLIHFQNGFLIRYKC